MALTAAYKTKLFKILGIPEEGAFTLVTSISHLPPALAYTWTSTYTVGNCTSVLSKLDEHLEDMSSTQQSEIETLIDRYEEIGSTSVLRITQSSQGAQGVIVDHEKERGLILERIGNVLGIFVPPMGFFRYTEMMLDIHERLEMLGDR